MGQLHLESIREKTAALFAKDISEDSIQGLLFNEALIAYDDEKAIEKKKQGLLEGKFGYQGNREAAYAFNDTLILQGNAKAIEHKLRGWAPSGYWYHHFLYGNPTKSKEFIETLVSQGHSRAIQFKIEGLAEGAYGYEQNLGAAKELLDSFVTQGHYRAIDLKFSALADGKFGYEADTEAAYTFMDNLISQGNLTALQYKLNLLMDGGGGTIYPQDPTLIPSLIDALIAKESTSRLGHVLKAFAMKVGTLGFKLDQKAANDSIRWHQIAY